MSDVRTDIANMALLRMGHSTITSFDDSTDAASKIRAQFDYARRMVLDNKWGFARKTVLIAADATAPENTDFSNRYLLPNDYIRIQRLEGAQRDYAVQREGNYLLSNAGPPLRLVYTYDEKNLNRWPPHALGALSCQLAMLTCLSITADQRTADRMTRDYGDTLAMALHSDSVQESHEPDMRNKWFEARIR